MSEHTLALIESIDKMLLNELRPSIHKRDEQLCFMRIRANLAELKFLVSESMKGEK